MFYLLSNISHLSSLPSLLAHSSHTNYRNPTSSFSPEKMNASKRRRNKTRVNTRKSHFSSSNFPKKRREEGLRNLWSRYLAKLCCLNIMRLLLLFILIITHNFLDISCLLIPEQYRSFRSCFLLFSTDQDQKEKWTRWTNRESLPTSPPFLPSFIFLWIFSASIPYWLDLPSKFWLRLLPNQVTIDVPCPVL